MYYEGVDEKYLLIRCNKCRHLLKYDKKYLLSNNNNFCTVNTPLKCSCGNISKLTINTEDYEKEKIKETIPIKCPKCGSIQISTNKKGFGLGKAIVGTMLTGGLIGIGAGFIGSNKIICTCLKCGKQWEPYK